MTGEDGLHTSFRREKAIPGGPTYPDHDHFHIDCSPDEDPATHRDWMEAEARARGGRLVVHLGLDSMSDFVVVETDALPSFFGPAQRAVLAQRAASNEGAVPNAVSHKGMWKMRWNPPGEGWTSAQYFCWPHDDRAPTVADAVSILRFADVVRADD